MIELPLKLSFSIPSKTTTNHFRVNKKDQTFSVKDTQKQKLMNLEQSRQRRSW